MQLSSPPVITKCILVLGVDIFPKQLCLDYVRKYLVSAQLLFIINCDKSFKQGGAFFLVFPLFEGIMFCNKRYFCYIVRGHCFDSKSSTHSACLLNLLTLGKHSSYNNIQETIVLWCDVRVIIIPPLLFHAVPLQVVCSGKSHLIQTNWNLRSFLHKSNRKKSSSWMASWLIFEFRRI